MPINRLLMDSKLTPEQRHVLILAFNQTLRRLNLVDQGDKIGEIVAQKIIDVGARGVTNAVAITEIAIRELGIPKP